MALTIKMQIDDNAEHQYYFATGDGGELELIPLVVSENGLYTPDEGKAYNRVTVNVPLPVLETLTVSTNGTYTAPDGKAYDVVEVDVAALMQHKSVTITSNGTTVITPESGYDGMDEVTVTVNVPNPSSGSIAINSNGTYDVTEKASAVVNVPNTYTQADEGKVVDNGALVSQTGKSVTANGTYDTTKNNSVVVNVPNPSSGSIAINANGTYDVTDKASAVVNVPNSYTQSDEGKVVSNGSLVAQTTRNVTSNGTYDTTENNSTVVNVQPNLTPRLEAEYDDNGTYQINVPSGYDGIGGVQVTVAVPIDDVEDNKLMTYNANGTYTLNPTSGYDTMKKATINVNVPTPAVTHFVKTGTFTTGSGTGESIEQSVDTSGVPTGLTLKRWRLYINDDWSTYNNVANKNRMIMLYERQFAPSPYSGTVNAYRSAAYKGSSGTTLTWNTANEMNLTTAGRAGSSVGTCVYFSGTAFKYQVFVNGSAYGLNPNTEYRYELIYE